MLNFLFIIIVYLLCILFLLQDFSLSVSILQHYKVVLIVINFLQFDIDFEAIARTGLLNYLPVDFLLTVPLQLVQYIIALIT